MKIKSALNVKFYVVTVLMLCMVALVWYGVYFINANEVMTDEGSMDGDVKALLTVILSVVATSWTLSLLTLVRQIILGYGFIMDEKGIHNTATAIMILSFVFVVPVKSIPYGAILSFSDADGVPTARLDKSRLSASPLLRPFVRMEYHFFASFTKDCSSEVKEAMKQYANK